MQLIRDKKMLEIDPKLFLVNGNLNSNPIVKEGDKILYGKYSGTEVNVAGTDYIIMRESDILAVM